MKVYECEFKCPKCANKLYDYDGQVRCINCEYKEERDEPAEFRD